MPEKHIKYVSQNWIRLLPIVILVWLGLVLLPDMMRSIGSTFAFNKAFSYQIYSLEEAYKWYNISLKIKPDNVLSYLALAKLALQENKIEVAIDYLEKAQKAASQNEVVRQELIRAYFSNEQEEKANLLMEDMSHDQLFILADSCLMAAEYTCAAKSYLQVVDSYEDESYILFLTAISLVFAQAKNAETYIDELKNQDQTFVVYQVEDFVHIPGEAFKLVQTDYLDKASHIGQPLLLSSDGEFASFNGINGEAISVISVVEEGNYQIQAQVGGGPGHVKMWMNIDGSSVAEFVLEPEMGRTWAVMNFDNTLYMDKGLHIVSVEFLDDLRDGTIRYAAIGNIGIQKTD